MVTVPLPVPKAASCASGDVELRANLLSGVGGGAHFALLDEHGAPIPGFTLNTSVLLAGNWIDGRVSWGDDESLATRVLTRFSGEVGRFCLSFAYATLSVRSLSD